MRVGSACFELLGTMGARRRCRAARAKERYWSDPVEREKIKARSGHNRQRRNRRLTV
jgi:hypothetical protein